MKHTLTVIPMYLFSEFKAPNYFFAFSSKGSVSLPWGKCRTGGMHWKKWEDICKPVGKGGLALRHLGCFNQALLAYWLLP